MAGNRDYRTPETGEHTESKYLDRTVQSSQGVLIHFLPSIILVLKKKNVLLTSRREAAPNWLVCST